MPVSLYGQPADLPALAEIAERHGLALVEDAAQAHGAAIGDRRSGSWGAGTFSFYPTKNMTTGEGGMVTTADAELAGRMRLLREHGMKVRYHHDIVGYNFRMTDLAAGHRPGPAAEAGRLQRAAPRDRRALRRRAARRHHPDRPSGRDPRLPPVHDPRAPAATRSPSA